MRRIMLAIAGVAAALVAPAAVGATVPPGAEDGVAIVREQAEAAAVEYFATVEGGAVSNIVCENPSADEAGVVFYCFGLNGAGAPVVAQATINDHGTPELAAAGAGPTAATSTTSPVLGSAQGTGSQVVQVAPINGPTIVAVTHEGSGEFAVQPQQGGVPAGPPLGSVTGPWAGRYLVGLGGTITGFAVTADGDWTLLVEQRSTALTFDTSGSVSAENADVIAYGDTEAWTMTVAYDGPGPIIIRAVTLSGAQELVNETAGFSGEIDVPAGPGFVSVEAPGRWSLQGSVPPTTTTSSTSTTTTISTSTTTTSPAPTTTAG